MMGSLAESSPADDPLAQPPNSAISADASLRPFLARLATKSKRIATNLLILGVIYVNAAIIFDYPLAKYAAGFSFPMNWRVYDCFQIFGVFSSYEMMNRDVEIYGITAPTPSSPEGRIIKLDLTEYFPFRRGEAQSRATVVRQLYMYGPVGQYEAYQVLAKKIRARYARLHPETPIEKIVIVQAAWRRNLEGFELLKLNENLTILFRE